MSLPCPEAVEYKHPVNVTRAVPKAKEEKFMSGAHLRQKIRSVFLLLNAAFFETSFNRSYEPQPEEQK